MAMWPNPQHYRPHDSIPGPEADRYDESEDPREDWEIAGPCPDCPACGGYDSSTLMGKLGPIAWWRCRQCGWTHPGN